MIEQSRKRRSTATSALRLSLALLVGPAAAAFAEQPGDVFRDCDVCPEMVVLPAGSFTMGSTKDERLAAVDDGMSGHKVEREAPPHRVTIPSLAMGRHEVTFEEWHACVADGACDGRGDRGRRRDTYPVSGVSWTDAQAYVTWLSAHTGEAYRLPSEAEWEYACRAGTTTRFAWGDREPTAADASFIGNPGAVTEVESHPANTWGLHDMHGNLWEWVEDCWNETNAGAPADGAPRTGGECEIRVARGGSWVDEPRYLRCAHREWYALDDRFTNLGFRVARPLR